MEETKTSRSVTIENNSPWFSGHFPNNPILPGVAQLKMVLDLISTTANKNVCMTGLSRIKFRKIIRPGDRLDIHLTCNNTTDQYSFRITNNNEDVCSGKMSLTNNKD